MPDRHPATLAPQNRPLDDGGAEWRPIALSGRGTTYACDQPGPSADAPAVVLLHGWTATGTLNWSSTMRALRARYRVIALDHRGHGRGIRSAEPFTLEDCADDAVALIDELGVRDAIFVGYSMGGPIAQLIWRRHPARVGGLVFFATAADFTTAPHLVPVVRALEHVQRATRLIPRSVRLRAVRPVIGGMVADPQLRDELLGAMGDHEEHSIQAAGRQIGRFRSTSWIGQIDVPVVVIVTKRDRLVRPALQRQLAASIPGARTISIDAAHLAAFLQPDLTAAAVTAACDAIAPRIVTSPRRRWSERFRRILRRLRRPSPRSRPVPGRSATRPELRLANRQRPGEARAASEPETQGRGNRRRSRRRARWRRRSR